jgi:hypothetical protein
VVVYTSIYVSIRSVDTKINWVGDIPLGGASLAIRYPTLPKSVKGMEIANTGLLVIHKTRQETKQGYPILPKSEKEKEIPKFLCW